MKIAFLLLVGIFMVASVSAGEYQGNPDRFPSVGISLIGNAEDGDSTTFGGGASGTQNVEVENGAFVVDLRLPVSDHITFTGAIGTSSTSVDAQETPLLFGQKSETEGVSFSVGVRFYIH